MSGIAAATGRDTERLVNGMLDRLEHRGPDSRWLCVGTDMVGGCANLAIDAHAGPPSRLDGEDRACIVADARIYNAEHLRTELTHRQCDTDSDSELILNLYREYGPACVGRMEGIFAFVIEDGGRLFAARDPLGIKPLYYAENVRCRRFASELKAFADDFTNVREFPPGHYFDSEQGFVSYYRFGTPSETRGRPEDLAEECVDTLSAAVQKRIPSAGEVGLLLSGGLDSSTVGVLAARNATRVHSFTAGTEDSEDMRYARDLAHNLGTQHHEYRYEIREMLDVLPQVIYHLESFDFLLVRSAVANYVASRMASDHVKVVLCGEGSDELFAGYDHLQECRTGPGLNSILKDMVFDSYSTGLRRVDRMNMASGVEGRMPYFDIDLMRFAFTVPECFKVHPDTGEQKWIVRKAFESHLPSNIAWRVKQKFSQGAGSYDMLAEVAENKIDDGEFARLRRLNNGHILRNKEEMMYYQIFVDFFGDSAEVLNTVGITPDA